MKKILTWILDEGMGILFFFFILLVIIVAFAGTLKASKEPTPLTYEVKEYYTNFSGFISTEEYMASFQEFSEDSYWIRVSRRNFDKVEFEVSTYQEAVMALEGFK